MSEEIGVVGSPEFTTGFRLAGVRAFAEVPESEKERRLDGALDEMLADEDLGIVVMHDEDVEHLSRDVREAAERSVDPVVVTLGGDASSGRLREQIKRAIGIDLMEEDT